MRCRFPKGSSSAEAAPLFCAGVTVYRALKNAEVGPGQRVAVFGVGGLGHLAVQMAKAFGAEVLALDVSDDKLALARELGAAQTFNVTGADVHKQVRKLGGAHVAVGDVCRQGGLRPGAALPAPGAARWRSSACRPSR